MIETQFLVVPLSFNDKYIRTHIPVHDKGLTILNFCKFSEIYLIYGDSSIYLHFNLRFRTLK